MRQTKLVCTIGPSSRQRLPELIAAGMDIARINFSHGTSSEHRETFLAVREAAGAANAPIGILADLSGPKIRLGELAGGSAEIRTGSRFVLDSAAGLGSAESASTNHSTLGKELRPGDRVLLADGAAELRVLASDGPVVTEVIRGGLVQSRSGVNVPSERLSFAGVSARDQRDLQLVIELGFDFVAQSFVRSVKDVHQLRSLIGGANIALIAKIETAPAVADADAIFEAADAVMVARGDLGVELPFAEVPLIQKNLLIKALSNGVPTIVATQMLESMVLAPRPTRAEASDVANAVLDGADAIMLSAETAVGKFPVEAVRAGVEIALTADQKGILPWGDRRGRTPSSEAQAIAHAAGSLAQSGAISAIACFTQSGLTARLLSAVRPKVPILTLSSDPSVVRNLTLLKGVIPRLSDAGRDTDSMLAALDAEIRSTALAKEGSLVVLVGTTPIGSTGTDFMKIHRVGDVSLRAP